MLRMDLLVRHVPAAGGRVRSCPGSVEAGAGPAEEALASLGDAVTVWSPSVLWGRGVEGLVRL